MKENTTVYKEYLKQAATELFKKRILETLSSYQDLIRSTEKILTPARTHDIVDITVLVNSDYPAFKECWHAIKSRVNKMKVPWWWFYESRLQIKLNEILTQYEHPLVVAQVIENAKLRKALDEAKRAITDLENLNQELEYQLKPSRLSSSKSASLSRSYSCQNLAEDSDEVSDIEMGNVGRKHQSCPDYKTFAPISTGSGATQSRMFTFAK